ncbi:hypothetical protein SAMN05421780_11060 [Flexibacter flexilis DSM 6793]|uniref:Uncharacterized protein n=1 Tax=Flexibacter flexilis DSM 6793 TaxID=927664 RepID=A0A1I1MDT0_9BACT|nr:hypothetical protein SAMN05421780_11060 [Flexibacter flexilis DSM 6793]
MPLIIFCVIVFIVMIVDNYNIKKDINATKKAPFNKNDAEFFYKNFNKFN